MTSLTPARLGEIEGKLEVWTDPYTHWLARYGLELIAALREARAENERLRTASAWQPIETAPKNDTFLVWLAESHGAMNSNVGIMHKHPKVSFVNGMFAFDLPPAMYWMPLPEPPQDRSA